jgi:uncharacterized protein involved in exopolysaccharide biosynthesis
MAQTSVLSIVAILLRQRRLVFICTAVTIGGALLFVILKSRTYTTSFSFVPQAAQDQSRAGLASLAGQLGVAIGGAAGGTQSPQLYADVLKTRETLEPIVRDSFELRAGGPRVQLTDLLHVKGENAAITVERALKALRARISASVAIRTTGMVSVTVTTPESAVSFEIARRLLKGVNDFNLDSRRSQAGQERRFTQGRLVEARKTLRDAEDALQVFLSSNRQLSNSPQLEFERNRLERVVSLQQQVMTGLAQSFEESRIREVRDTPVISVIERPVMAATPDPRGGLLILSAGAAVGLLIGIIAALVRDTFARLARASNSRDVAQFLSAWRDFRGQTHG